MLGRFASGAGRAWHWFTDQIRPPLTFVHMTVVFTGPLTDIGMLVSVGRFMILPMRHLSTQGAGTDGQSRRRKKKKIAISLGFRERLPL
jgi:hypothetical protein